MSVVTPNNLCGGKDFLGIRYRLGNKASDFHEFLVSRGQLRTVTGEGQSPKLLEQIPGDFRR